MPSFISIEGTLSSPTLEHPGSPKYTPIRKGAPLCVEILHIGFGDVEDWWKNSEILVSSWSRIGGSPKAGPRLLNVMRTGIKPFDYLDDLGASEYGNRLVAYSPAYDGQPLQMTVECLEIDALGQKGTKTLAAELKKLAGLAVFAPQLAYLAGAEPIIELGRKLYNLFNNNDLLHIEHLDLAFQEQDTKHLSSGRFLMVRGSHNEATFAKKFRLNNDNRLETVAGGKLAHNAGMTDPYVVLRIDAVERPQYKGFEQDSIAQELLDQVLVDPENLATDLIRSIEAVVKGSHNQSLMENVLKTSQKVGKASAEDKALLQEEIKAMLKKLPDELSTLLRDTITAP